MSATAKFYTGLFVVLAIIVFVSYSVGYKVGRATRQHAPVPVHRPTTAPHVLPSL